ncbi:AraC family transcriptional regulator [Sandaracinomonas limnophila]|uniref:AraC family transcriptional regulator n=1 Tax=Sandaracinomonas limnophila TaxID=1862386 RepID=A0A437PQ16_9BACT|nr:helix-turn-helix domain-containing protein [Sandaracinomonas limnophila]RVU24249.1 AraC family transcriptional regulator [Sandaracinomonas limnophila]
MLSSFFEIVYLYVLPSFLFLVGIRLTFNSKSLFTNFLGLYLIGFYFFILIAWIIKFKLFAFWPHLVHVTDPIHYLLGPFSYLFFLFGLKPYRKFKLLDCLHFLPFVLHVLELTPFFLLSKELKEQEFYYLFNTQLIAHLQHVEAYILEVKMHLFFKTMSVLIYYFASLYLFIRFYLKSKTFYFKSNNKEFFIWLALHTLLKGVIIFNLLLISFHVTETMALVNFVVVLDFICTSLFFVLYPKYQDGLQFESIKEVFLEEKKPASDFSKDIWMKNKFEEMNMLMEMQAPFVDENFSKVQLAKMLNLNLNQLTVLISKFSNQSFPDYVAHWRIVYIKKMMAINDEWKGYSIEILAENSGFGTRQSLYRTIQRFYQMNPNEYFKQNTKTPISPE